MVFRREFKAVRFLDSDQEATLPSMVISMNAIRDSRTNVAKLRSLLRKSAEVCSEIGYHVADAEQEIKRIEQRLRADASVAASADAAARTAQPTAKEGGNVSAVQALVVNTKAARGARG